MIALAVILAATLGIGFVIGASGTRPGRGTLHTDHPLHGPLGDIVKAGQIEVRR